MMEARSVYCEVRTAFLNAADMNFKLQRVTLEVELRIEHHANIARHNKRDTTHRLASSLDTSQ